VAPPGISERATGPAIGISLSEYIAALRAELAQQLGDAQNLRFGLGPLDVELILAASRSDVENRVAFVVVTADQETAVAQRRDETRDAPARPEERPRQCRRGGRGSCTGTRTQTRRAGPTTPANTR
jgi:hypothetical protein